MPKKPKSHAIRHWLSVVRTNYWFIPAVTIAACLGLAYLMLELDAALPEHFILKLGWVYTRDPAGARAILSVISESMMTVAGVVFSVMLVALTLASNQFGTRVLKSFARDAANQVVLGVFLGTFLYCLLVLRRVQSQPHPFVPSLSVAGSIFLAITSVVLFVYFIHHVIIQIQAESIVATVAHDVYDTIDFVFPEDMGRGIQSSQPPSEHHLEEAGMQEVRAVGEGMIRSIDSDRILELAVKHDAIIDVGPLPGSFISSTSILARFTAPADRRKELAKDLQECFDIGPHRTYEQDLRFAFDQLSLIAVRSLSPAINAVGTAEDAVRWLKAALIRLGGREIPSGYRYDKDDRLRVVTRTWDLSQLLSEVFDPIRQSSRSLPAFVLRVIEALGDAAHDARNPALRSALAEQIRRFGNTANDFPQEVDRHHVRVAADRLLQSLNGRS